MNNDNRMTPTRRQALASLGAGAAALSFAGQIKAAPVFPQGAVIRTVLRDYAPGEIANGATLFHEHMSLSPDFLPKWAHEAQKTAALNNGTPPPPPMPPPAPAKPGDPPYFAQDADLMTAEMTAAKADGVACIVDGGHPDMGRDVNFLKTISQRSGLPIVVGGGLYNAPFYPKETGTQSEDQIFEVLMNQVRSEPIGAFGEIGSWDYIEKTERRVFRAVGRASAATNICVFTHTGIPGKSALEQLDILEDAGADPKRICIGHLGHLAVANLDVLKTIARRGAFVGFDRQGGPGDDTAIPLVVKMIEAGFLDNILLASDLAGKAQLKSSNPALGYAKTVTVFGPKLKAAGVTDAQLKQMLNDNSRRLLAYVPKIRRPAAFA